MKRSFVALDPQQALHVAIFIEERNAEIYHRFAEMFVEFRDPESLEIAAVFWEMAIEERRHSSLLQGKYMEQYGNARCDVTEEDVSELLEVPSLGDSDVFAEQTETVLAPRDRALQVGLQAELSAQRYYANLVEKTHSGPLRRLYSELAQMEDGHIAYLESKLAHDAASGEKPN